MEQWKATEATVTLTNEEWSELWMYLKMTANHRKGELEACRSFAEEKDEQGNTKYPNMESNAKFWDEMNTTIDDIMKAIDNRKML